MLLLLAEREQDRAFEVSPAMAVGHGEATEENRKNRHEAMDERLGGCSSILGEMHALTPNRVRFRLTRGDHRAGGLGTRLRTQAAPAGARLTGGAAEYLKPTHSAT